MKKYMFFLFLFFVPLSVFADTGRSTIVMDLDSGRILYEKEIHESRLIASITKIMTCIITLENTSLEDSIIVGDEVLDIYGTNIYVQKGEVLTVEDLLYGLMLRSGNDAAMVLANHVFSNYDMFIQKMNEKAISVGMKNTTFSNPHGLDEDTQNYSTAYDMALLAQYAFQNPIYRKIIATKKYNTKSNFKSYIWYNRMSLLTQYSNCLGGKNGYTPAAGKTLVSYASLNSLRLLIVSLNDSDIYENHQSLYHYYFDLYQSYTILDKKSFYVDSSLIGKDVYIKNSFSYPLREAELDDVSTMIFVSNQDGNEVGRVLIQLHGSNIGEVPIYERKQKKKKPSSFFQKFIDWISDKN